MQHIHIIAAVSENGVIGNHGKLPWRIPDDIAFFHREVFREECTAIMGRGTWNSLPEKYRPLPQCKNIVLSRKIPSGRCVYTPAYSVHEALSCAGNTVYVVGGADIYKLFLAHAHTMLITIVEGIYEGDAYFPFPPADIPLYWELVHSHQVPKKDGVPAHRFNRYERLA